MLRFLCQRASLRSLPNTILNPRDLSRTRSMSSRTSPFTQAVITSMRKLYPEALADKSFDNTGLLLEAPFNPLRRRLNNVLLTIDLTREVADEALENKSSILVAYHPIIFRGLKSLTFNDSQQASLLRLVSEGVSVYCPHTAVDTVPGGMADWLGDIVSGRLDAPEPETRTALQGVVNADPDLQREDASNEDTERTTESESEAQAAAANQDPDSDPFIERPPRHHPKRVYSKPTYPIPAPAPSPSFGSLHPSAVSHTRSVLTPSPQPSLDAANALTKTNNYTNTNTGAGRLITFSSPQPLPLLIERIASGVGRPKGFPVAIPQGSHVEDLSIQTVAICPGSGSHVFSGVAADLYFTGELSHHQTLSLTEQGGCVVTLFHSNSERGYLSAVMQRQLQDEVKREWDRVRKEIMAQGGLSEELESIVNDDEVRVEVSISDRDPFGIVVLQDSRVEGEVL